MVMIHFQKMNNDSRHRYWLKYFQMPITRSPSKVKLAGYSERSVAKFWKFSSFLQGLIIRFLFVQALFVMTAFSSAYLIMMQKYRYHFSPVAFWTILIVSFQNETVTVSFSFLQTL